MFCRKCGKQINDQSLMCPYCGEQLQYVQPQINYGYNMMERDETDIAINILAFFIPMFGLIYYFVDKSKHPIRAKGALKSAITSVLVSILIYVLIFLLIVGMSMLSVTDCDVQKINIINEVYDTIAVCANYV